jgi:hypothetical protein
MEIYIHALLTSALVGGERSASHPNLSTPRLKVPGTHWRGTAGLDAVKKRKKNPSLPLLEIEPQLSSP